MIRYLLHKAEAYNTNRLRNTSTTANLFGVCFLSEDEGYAVGAGGTIIRLTEGGDQWEYINSGTANQLNDIDF